MIHSLLLKIFRSQNLAGRFAVNNIKIEAASKIFFTSLKCSNLSSRLLSTPLNPQDSLLASLRILPKFGYPDATSTTPSKLVRIHHREATKSISLDAPFPDFSIFDLTWQHPTKMSSNVFFSFLSTWKMIYQDILLIKQLCNLISSEQFGYNLRIRILLEKGFVEIISLPYELSLWFIPSKNFWKA